jgi:hypothetical protein
MLRSGAARSMLKSSTKSSTARLSFSTASFTFRNAPLRQLNNRRPQVLLAVPRPTTKALPYATKPTGVFDPLDPKEIKEVAELKLDPTPENVSLDSSVRHVFEHTEGKKKSDDEMLGGIKADIETIKDTFALTEVPRESLYIGAAGVIPYAATSLSTVYLAWDINHANSTGQGVIFSPETARQLLDLVTPVQIGYGAVVSSSTLTCPRGSSQ